MTSTKQTHKVRAMMCLAGAVLIPLGLVLFAQDAEKGIFNAIFMGIVFLGCAGYQWYKFRQTPDDQISYDVTDLSLPEQAQKLKVAIALVALAGPVLTYWTYHEIRAVGTGAEATALVWAPIAFLYNTIGFWPAVLCWPVFCVAFIVFAILRLKKIQP